jgi:hypothetical protein
VFLLDILPLFFEWIMLGIHFAGGRGLVPLCWDSHGDASCVSPRLQRCGRMPHQGPDVSGAPSTQEFQYAALHLEYAQTLRNCTPRAPTWDTPNYRWNGTVPDHKRLCREPGECVERRRHDPAASGPSAPSVTPRSTASLIHYYTIVQRRCAS